MTPAGRRRVRRVLAPTLAGIALTLAASALATAGDAADQALRERGRIVYAGRCAGCHGPALEGKIRFSPEKPCGEMLVPPLNDKGYAWRYSDGKLFGIVRVGEHFLRHRRSRYTMPPHRTMISAEDVWAVIAFIKSTWPRRLRESQAELTKRIEKLRRTMDR